ncbi:MAG: glutamate--tRNA ligase [Archaeoglobi archaeon]|nr:glutamate--tRNA ligase [Candidatus Mnemosynella sp.]
MNTRELILKHALANALKYGKAEKGAVIGKVVAEVPELKKELRNLMPLFDEVISHVNSLSKEEIERLLREISPEIFEKKREKREVTGLPPLDYDHPVMRFAPNPNGPPTLGSARGMVINGEYARMHDGKLILRFDDTDPKTKRPIPEAYDWYVEDYEWLGYKPDVIISASERIPVYYEYAEKLIEMGFAYVCECSREEFKKFKDSSRACPHRERAIEENFELWEKMLSGELSSGEAVLRIKTEMEHPDPAVRDWVAFRIIDVPHPIVGDRFRVWPTLDFESAIEDHLQKVTHIIRGKDLRDSEARQRYIYSYFNWEYPKTIYWGRLKIHEFGKLSTSMIAKGIQEGIYTGWDDVRLPTLRALRRRGITAEAIRRFFISLGIGENDISISMENLYAENRKIIDGVARRYFFVHNPVRMKILEFPERLIARAPLHPKKDIGFREIEVRGEVFIAESDFRELKEGDRIRLKDLCNVEITSLNPLKARYEGENLKGYRIIHWAPPDGVKTVVLSPDGTYEGISEKGVIREVGNVVQFERFGFARIEKLESEILQACFSHK